MDSNSNQSSTANNEINEVMIPKLKNIKNKVELDRSSSSSDAPAATTSLGTSSRDRTGVSSEVRKKFSCVLEIVFFLFHSN
jgi:hypothetical protein